MRWGAVLLGLTVACGPRVPPAPPVPPPSSEGRPPPTAVARVAQGWVALAHGDVDLAAAKAGAARRLDPYRGEPRRLLAAATGDDVALVDAAGDEACAPCLAAVALRAPAVEADAWWAAAVDAGLPADRLVAEGPWPPGPQTLAAWVARSPRSPGDALWRAVALAEQDPFAELALPEGPPAPRAWAALAAAGRPATALSLARAAGRRHPHDPAVLRTWLAIAADAGHGPDRDAAVRALLDLPVSVLSPGDADVRAASTVLAEGSLPAGVSAEEAALWTAHVASPGVASRAFAALPAPSRAGEELGELTAWLAAARRVGAGARLPVEDGAPPSVARLLAAHRWVSGDRDGAAAIAVGQGGEPDWWPVLREAPWDASGHPAGLGAVPSELPERVARATAPPDAPWRRYADGDVAGACAALPDAVLGQADPVPGVGPLGYACARRGSAGARLWTALRWAHERAPGDGLVALGLGLVTLEVGDVDEAARLLSEARRLLPGRPDLAPDLSRAADAVWSTHPLAPPESP